MGYVYSDWKQQATIAERVTRGLQYVQELDDKITATISSGSKSRASDTLLGLRALVAAEVEKEQDRKARSDGTGVGTGHPVRFGEA